METGTATSAAPSTTPAATGAATSTPSAPSTAPAAGPSSGDRSFVDASIYEGPRGTLEVLRANREKVAKAVEEAAKNGETASPVPANEIEIEQEAPAVDGENPEAGTDEVVDDTQNGNAEVNPEAQAEEEIDFEPLPAGPLPPQELQSKLKEIPELNAILEQNPELRNSLFAASRLAQKAVQYEEQFPGGIDEARIAAEGNRTFAEISDLITGIKDKKTAQEALRGMMRLSYVLDDEGNPVLDPETKTPVSDGTVGRLIEHTFGLGLDHWANIAQQKGDDELAAAIDVLRARAFNTRTAPAQESISDEQRAQYEQLERERAELNRQQQAIESEKRQAFEQKADQAYYRHVDNLLNRVLAKANLADADKQAIYEEIKVRVDKALAQNPQFLSAQEAIWRRQGYGEKKLNDLTALGSQWVNAVLPGIARQVLQSKGQQIIAGQAAKQAQIKRQEQASRSEAKSAMRHVAPNAKSTDEVHAQARKEFAEKFGREPNTVELLRAVTRVRMGQKIA
jgi:hypothetical protein